MNRRRLLARLAAAIPALLGLPALAAAFPRDDTARVQAFLDTGGGLLPAGTYRIHRPLRLNGATLDGSKGVVFIVGRGNAGHLGGAIALQPSGGMVRNCIFRMEGCA